MTITAKERKKQRDQLRREMDRDLKQKDRENLKRLRQAVRDAKAHKRERMGEIVQMCRTARTTNRERAKAIRAAARLEANQRIEQLRTEARTACEARKDMARKKGNTRIATATERLDAERQYQRTMRIYGKAAKPGTTKVRTTAAERRAESDDEVERNLPDDLIPVFRRVKDRMKATPRRTRTEAFLQWAHDHPADVYRITDEAIEADIQELIRQEAELAREVRKPNRYTRLSDDALSARYDEAVPF